MEQNLKSAYIRKEFNSGLSWYKNMAAVSLFWNTNMAAVMSCENALYREIPKISPGAYIFQRPFLRGLFLEGLIFGGAYLRKEICV